MKKTVKTNNSPLKITLSKQTVRNLSSESLTRVVGGANGPSNAGWTCGR